MKNLPRTTLNGFWLTLCLFVLASWNCSENPVSSGAGVAPELSDVTVPAVLFGGSSKSKVISVRVVDPQGRGDISSVTFNISRQAATLATGALSDDGTGGDLLPGDDIYSVLIQGTFAQGDTGSFTMTIVARDQGGNETALSSVTLRVAAGTESSAPVIAQVNLPPTLPVDSLFTWAVTAQVLAEAGTRVENVTMDFFPPTSPVPTLQQVMVDDGSSADVQAGDGVYTATFQSGLFSELSDYFFRFIAEDDQGNRSSPLVVIVRGRNQFGSAPVITGAAVPRMVNGAQTNPVLVTAALTDREGLGDIDSVQFRLLVAGQGELPDSRQQMFDDGTGGDLTANDGTYSALLQVPASGDSVVDYTLAFDAVDKTGLRSASVQRRLVIGFDDFPYISNLVAPDQVILNPNQATLIQITLDVRDPQGLADIILVEFRSFLPSGEEANGSPIEMFDNGDAQVGDETAGDGIFSRIVFLPPTGVTPGDFRWEFEARDASGARSNKIIHVLTVITP